MKSIKEIKNPDIIKINNEKFQVIENTTLWYHTDRNELEMVVELIKLGEKQITPNYRITYFYKKPDKRKFFVFDKKIKRFKEIELKSVNLSA